jgi:hypothetical protein
MESISEADEQWLDHEANTVDEERVLHDLETASNYKRGLERLDEDGKAIVKKLREWAGDIMNISKFGKTGDPWVKFPRDGQH